MFNNEEAFSVVENFLLVSVIMTGDCLLEYLAGCALWFIDDGKCFFILLFPCCSSLLRAER